MSLGGNGADERANVKAAVLLISATGSDGSEGEIRNAIGSSIAGIAYEAAPAVPNRDSREGITP